MPDFIYLRPTPVNANTYHAFTEPDNTTDAVPFQKPDADAAEELRAANERYRNLLNEYEILLDQKINTEKALKGELETAMKECANLRERIKEKDAGIPAQT